MNIQIHDIFEETQVLHITHSTTGLAGLHHLFMSQILPMAHYQGPLYRFTSVKMHSKNDNDNVLEAWDSAGSNSWVVSNDDQNYHILFPPLSLQPVAGQDYFIIQASRSRSDIPYSVELI